MGTIYSLVPTLRVEMPVRDVLCPVPPLDAERLGGIPTRSVGTRERPVFSFLCSAWERKKREDTQSNLQYYNTTILQYYNNNAIMQPIELTTKVTSEGYIQLPNHYKDYYGRIVKLMVFFSDSVEEVQPKRSLAAELLAIGRQCAASPLLDNRSPDDILGYDNHGIPS